MKWTPTAHTHGIDRYGNYLLSKDKFSPSYYNEVSYELRKKNSHYWSLKGNRLPKNQYPATWVFSHTKMPPGKKHLEMARRTEKAVLFQAWQSRGNLYWRYILPDGSVVVYQSKRRSPFYYAVLKS